MTQKELTKLARRFKWGALSVEQCPVSSPERSAHRAMSTHCGIYEMLLNAWARMTKCYLADIVYDFYAVLSVAQEIDREEENGLKRDKEYVIYIFGLRECGVDGPDFIKSRTADGHMADYKRLYMVTLTATRDGYTQKLYKATRIAEGRGQDESEL